MLQRFSSLSSWWGTWGSTGRHGSEEGAKTSISGMTGSRIRESHWNWLEFLKTQISPPVAHFI